VLSPTRWIGAALPQRVGDNAFHLQERSGFAPPPSNREVNFDGLYPETDIHADENTWDCMGSSAALSSSFPWENFCR
jgi:hypothetical protein